MVRNVEWRHESVRRLAGDDDPIQVITERVRRLVEVAMDKGWEGPPFDPIVLATQFLDLRVVASDSVAEARTVTTESGTRIEFNPNRPRERRRYSVAHEIAHTLFPDHSEHVRQRGSHHSNAQPNDWQLEVLCNLAAAEILMPIGSLQPIGAESIGVDLLIGLRPKYDVSMEAVLIRAVNVSDFSCAAFTASRIDSGARLGRYRLDYMIGSTGWNLPILTRGTLLSADTAVAACTAIGYTAKGHEVWNGARLRVECVGIPPFPWSAYPRVAGIVLPEDVYSSAETRFEYVTGNALEPRGSGRKVLAQVVNDRTPNWGGRGFATALRRAWPDVQSDFQHWISSSPARLRLGNVRLMERAPDLAVASMIAQKGYGDTLQRRLRYTALEACLGKVADYALANGATVHMPRIGTGYGGGAWPVIEEIIKDTLCRRGVKATVYDLPDSRSSQGELQLA